MYGKTKENGILKTLSKFPLFKGTFLHMQLINIELVDHYLEQLEANLLSEYDKKESTPLPQAMFVSAISQMWVFALYELLRTWKQWVDELVKYGDHLVSFDKGTKGIKKRNLYIQSQKLRMNRGTRLGILSDPFYSQSFRDIENKSGYLSALRSSKDILLPLFRDLEAVRVTLARHEIPKSKGIRAQAPGYARIDMSNGSLNWMILYSDGSAQIITRKELADECRRLHPSAHKSKSTRYT